MDSSTGTPFVQYLPTGQEPRRLTAEYRSKNLKEHFESFMAVNGLRQSSKESGEITKTVLDHLAVLASRPSMTVKQFKDASKRVRQMIDPPLGERSIVEKNVRHLLAQILGYENYTVLWESLVAGVPESRIPELPIENKRPTRLVSEVVQKTGTRDVPKDGLEELRTMVESFQLDQPRPEIVSGDWRNELIRFAWLDTATREKFSSSARSLKVALADRFKHGELLVALAWAFGYKDWQAITARYPDKTTPVPNLRKTMPP